MLNNFKIKAKMLILSFIMLIMISILGLVLLHNEIISNNREINLLDTTIRKNYTFKRQYDIDTIIAKEKELKHKELIKNIIIFIILSTLSIFLSIIITYIISKNITFPIQIAVDQAKQIPNSLLETKFPEHFNNRRDEVGELVTSLNKMNNSISNIIKNVNVKADTLMEENKLLYNTLMSASDGIISTDKNGNVRLVNTTAEKLLGWKQDEVLGKAFDEIFNIIYEKTREKCESPLKIVFSTKRTTELNYNILLISKEGAETPIEDSASPIRNSEGFIIGMILIFRDISEKKKKNEKIQYLSFHDQLTKLHNRRFFENALERMDIEENYPLGFIIADVNGLKLANDAFGHLVGDKLLQKAAYVMKKSCKANDVIARIGGDEFAILLPKTNLRGAELLVEKMQKSTYFEKVGSINLSISFGCACKNTCSNKIANIFKKAEKNMYKQKLCESQNIKLNIINIIIDTMCEKFKGIEDYYLKISNLCEMVGKQLNLPDNDIEDLRTAALLHDIGNISLDENILNKPDKLTNLERFEIQHHPETGYHILNSVNNMAKVSEYVLDHHERWDGKGYPRGLKGDKIPIQSRIISIVDTYATLINKKPYRKAFTKEQTIEIIRKNSGTQFDPAIIKEFIKVLEQDNVH